MNEIINGRNVGDIETRIQSVAEVSDKANN